MTHTTTISSVVRILIFKLPLAKEGVRLLVEPVEVKKIEVFPLAFKYSEDFEGSSYEKIKKIIEDSPLKVASLLPRVEAGFYEIVGDYNSVVKITDGECEVVNWSIENQKIYQLTEKEVEALGEDLVA